MTRTFQRRQGFTITEVLIASSMAAILMAAVLSSFVFIGRNLARLASYQSLESEARKALAYLRQDLALAQAVKNGTTPTTATVTLVLPGGNVTYTYESGNRRLRRQATFGANTDFTLLRNSTCECTSFAFDYFTTNNDAPTDQITSTTLVPYSIKQIAVGFVVETPTTASTGTRTRFEAASARYFIRNRGLTDGT
ncbi:MAG TPA: prepilin-type N-terminal cleavage/methylation domain-containing protein [Opitutaceae bacterium]|nr:prepilin-type N-terminal cleavage/methylation domain-containing protein [Opitutaceae bacterium]